MREDKAMSAEILSLYLKLNILLFAALILWLLTRRTAGVLGFDVNSGQQLVTARFLFLAFILMLPAAWLLASYLPDF